ncbi:MAG: hypothetical protein SGILL_010544 [Bacillariaceae sp.]
MPESKHSRESSSLKRDVETQEEEARGEANDDASDDLLKAESPGKSQASKFFTNLLHAGSEEEVMAGISFQESRIQPSSRGPMISAHKPSRNSAKSNEREGDASVSTFGSGSAMTNISQPSIPRVRSDLSKKAVRWVDDVERRSHQQHPSPTRSGTKEPAIIHNAPRNVDRITETRRNCDDEISRDSKAGGSFSTEDGSLQGSRLLPPRQPNSFPLHNNRFQEFRRSQQAQLEQHQQEEQQLEQSESRDDTVHTRDSAFFSYTYSSASNYSRDAQEYSEQSNSDDNSNSHRSTSESTGGGARYHEQSLHTASTQLRQVSSLDNNVNGRAVSHDGRRQLSENSRAWSPRFMNLFAKQREALTDSMPGRSASGSNSDSSASNHSTQEMVASTKPLPYDEQKEEAVSEELPFDQANRRETVIQTRNSDSSDSVEVQLEEERDEAEGISEVESLTVDTSA